MKILLIHSEKDTEAAAQVQPLLQKIKSAIEKLPVQPLDSTGGDIKKQFAAFFSSADLEGKDKHASNAPTHVLVVSPIAQRWLDFLAGFSYGSHLPLLAYGKEAIAAIPVEFASFFRTLVSEKSFEEYFEAESEAFENWKSAREILKARDTLLQMGIPVTGEALANCAGEGDIREVSLFLDAGFSPDTRNKSGVPLLNIAARKGNWEILKLLIGAGAGLNTQADDRGTSPLLDSVMSKNLDMVNALIEAGANLDIKSKDGQTALVVAVGAGDEKIVEVLLRAGADADISDSMGVSARKYANLFHKKNITALFKTHAPERVEAGR
ncbi:MAG: ankyrin repeat domain-containing protein [Treponema sp.]|nr:ankyrin repeat domain-containing protein [Treponema sp.]